MESRAPDCMQAGTPGWDLGWPVVS